MHPDRFLGIEELNEHYCGPQCEKPRDEFNPMTDVKQGDFVLLLPNDTKKVAKNAFYGCTIPKEKGGLVLLGICRFVVQLNGFSNALII